MVISDLGLVPRARAFTTRGPFEVTNANVTERPRSLGAIFGEVLSSKRTVVGAAFGKGILFGMDWKSQVWNENTYQTRFVYSLERKKRTKFFLAAQCPRDARFSVANPFPFQIGTTLQPSPIGVDPLVNGALGNCAELFLDRSRQLFQRMRPAEAHIFLQSRPDQTAVAPTRTPRCHGARGAKEGVSGGRHTPLTPSLAPRVTTRRSSTDGVGNCCLWACVGGPAVKPLAETFNNQRDRGPTGADFRGPPNCCKIDGLTCPGSLKNTAHNNPDFESVHAPTAGTQPVLFQHTSLFRPAPTIFFTFMRHRAFQKNLTYGHFTK